MSTDKIDLPADSVCPCGSKDLLLAKDRTEYMPLTKEGDTWEYGVANTEAMDNDDPMGNVRLFCTVCGQYFNVPEELQ